MVVEKQETDLFSEEDIYQFEYASTGQRFLNFLIDWLLMRFGLSYLTSTVLINFLLAVSPETAYRFFSEGRSLFDLIIASYMLSVITYIPYYTICEKAFKGYTLGKLITGTRAVRENGKELRWKDAFFRSASRLVPFEVFSAFGGHPWHDGWTETMVVKSR